MTAKHDSTAQQHSRDRQRAQQHRPTARTTAQTDSTDRQCAQQQRTMVTHDGMHDIYHSTARRHSATASHDGAAKARAAKEAALHNSAALHSSVAPHDNTAHWVAAGTESGLNRKQQNNTDGKWQW